MKFTTVHAMNSFVSNIKWLLAFFLKNGPRITVKHPKLLHPIIKQGQICVGTRNTASCIKQLPQSCHTPLNKPFHFCASPSLVLRLTSFGEWNCIKRYKFCLNFKISACFSPPHTFKPQIQTRNLAISVMLLIPKKKLASLEVQAGLQSAI